MYKRFALAAGFAGVVALNAAACSKSSTPLTPTPAPSPSTGPSTLKVNAPTPVSPRGNVRIESFRPRLVVNEARPEFVNAPAFTYRIEVIAPNGSVAYGATGLRAADGVVRHDVPFDLALDTRYTWRARAETVEASSPWSETVDFRTLDYRGIVPRPANGTWPRTGQAVVDYVAAAFPERLVVTRTDDERIAHMAWLRDRIIEAGICGGLDFAWNLKRGVGPHSIDAIAWRIAPGDVRVMDLAAGYDDHDSPLRLHFIEVGGAPGYDPYTNHPGC